MTPEEFSNEVVKIVEALDTNSDEQIRQIKLLLEPHRKVSVIWDSESGKHPASKKPGNGW